MNNYDLFFKHGYILEDNPYKESYIVISFDSVPEYFMEDISWKQKALLVINDKLRTFMKVRPDGTIN